MTVPATDLRSTELAAFLNLRAGLRERLAAADGLDLVSAFRIVAAPRSARPGRPCP